MRHTSILSPHPAGPKRFSGQIVLRAATLALAAAFVSAPRDASGQQAAGVGAEAGAGVEKPAGVSPGGPDLPSGEAGAGAGVVNGVETEVSEAGRARPVAGPAVAIVPEAAPGSEVEAQPGSAVTPSLLVNPAGRVRDLLDQRLVVAERRVDEIGVDLTVLEQNGSLEAQLREARLEAERERLAESVAELKRSVAGAAAAARDLARFADAEEVRRVFADLKAGADSARQAFEDYQSDREGRIARAEASSPPVVQALPLASEAIAYLSGALDGMDDSQRSNFRALVQAVASELGVRVPRLLPDGREVMADYVNVLEPGELASSQMALLTLVAYRNRADQAVGGTLLGPEIETLVDDGDITPVRGQSYRIGAAAMERHLTGPLHRVWGAELEIVPGEWDLSQRTKTAAALRRFAGEEGAPNPVLLGVLDGFDELVDSRERSAAITSELARAHADALDRARRVDLRMEGMAGAVFQADGLHERHADEMAGVEAARAFFAEEAARLADPLNRPRQAELRSHAAALGQASIALQRAEQIGRLLAGGPSFHPGGDRELDPDPDSPGALPR